jgi:hypothetical protein
MSEQITAPETAPKSKGTRIVRIVLQWAILGLLAFTCIMAAYRKFGG